MSVLVRAEDVPAASRVTLLDELYDAYVQVAERGQEWLDPAPHP